jgi:hypothetical protein
VTTANPKTRARKVVARRAWMIAAMSVAAATATAAATRPGVVTGVPSPKSLKFKVDAPLGGVASAYAPILDQKIRSWPPAEVVEAAKTPAASDSNPVRLQCVETPGSRFYIGLIQHMHVAADVSKVAEVLNDFVHYKELFPDFDDIHVVSREDNKILTFWEQHIPVFFIPNVKYEVIYVVDDSRADRKFYRYELSKVNHIKNNDGLIVLEPDEKGGTRYTEYDFFDADWGPLTTFAPGRIWKDSVEGIYLSDVAIGLKAEHPDWTYKQVAQESRKKLEAFPVDAAIEHKIQLLK